MDFILTLLLSLVAVCIGGLIFVHLRSRRAPPHRQGLAASWEQLNDAADDAQMEDGHEGQGDQQRPAAAVGRLDRIKARRQREKEERRQALEGQREDRRKKREEEMAKRDADEEKDIERQRLEDETLQHLRRERADKMEAEYKEWVSHIEVEEKGEALESDPDFILQKMGSKIRHDKVAQLQDLSREFEMDVDHAVASIEKLVARGDLSGVFDDRGKFICVTDAEFEAVARFIRQRGRTSMQELVVECNRCIRLSSEETAVAL